MFSDRLLRRTFLVLATALFSANLFAADDVTYLALGDSIAFGLDITKIPSPPDVFVGYPEMVAATKHVQHVKKLANAACPGETSGSFLSAEAPDNQCRAYKGMFELHTTYVGTQESFLQSTLQSDKHIELITIGLGGNDLILLQLACNPASPAYAQCVLAGLPEVFQSYAQNLATILTSIRQGGQYNGLIVLVTLHSPTPTSDLLTLGAVSALNATAVAVASQFDVKIADGFGAFQLASVPFGGDPCAAGLLNALGPGVCDVHPSPKGQALLASTVVKVVGTNGKRD